jgi:DNA polymerase IV
METCIASLLIETMKVGFWRRCGVNETSSPTTKTILHVDINSYFATLLQQENPLLRGRPIGITKDHGRTCLIATSKEAKRYGVKTGCRLKEAKQLCPQIIPIPAQFGRYLDATKRLKKLFESFSPDVEIYSLDEAFIDLTNCLTHLYPSPHHVATTIKHRIVQELGEWVTCNIGIGRTRFLAKMGSEISPPDTIFTITDQNQDAVLASTTFEDVCGIGYRLGKKLHRLGITTPYMIRFYSEAELEPVVGPFWAKELLKMAYGDEPHHLERLSKPETHMKSVGRSITGWKLADSEEQIKRVLYNLTEEVTHKVRQMDLAGRYISIHLTGQDTDGEHRGWYAHRTLQYCVRHSKPMFEVLYHQLYKPWRRSFSVIKFAIRLGMLQPMNQITPSLLPEWDKQERLSQAMDSITQRYGLFTLRSGLLTNDQGIIKPEVTGYLGDKQYQFRE